MFYRGLKHEHVTDFSGRDRLLSSWVINEFLKDVTKYTHHSSSNVSHLPTVDQRIERWIQKYQCQKIMRQMPSQDRFTRDSKSSSHGKVWHIASQKHDIHIKCSKCSFFSSLRHLPVFHSVRTWTIDKNRWSENQSINRWQSINYCWLASIGIGQSMINR